MQGKWLIGMVAVALAGALRAEILMCEGFPTGDGGYSTAANQNLRNVEVSSAAVYGFDATTFTGGNFVYTFGSDSGLALPTTFPASYAVGGDASAGFKANLSYGTAMTRAVNRKLAAGILDRTSGKLYFRALMSAEDASLAQLTGSDSFALHSYYAAGLVGCSYFDGNGVLGATLKGSITYITGAAFAYVLDAAGTTHISLVIRDTANEIHQYPIVNSPVSGATYIGLLEIDVNAGTDGKEKVRAMVQNVASYDPAFDYAQLDGDSAYVEAEFMGDSKGIAYLVLDGKLNTANSAVKFDELAVATEADDLVYIQSATGSYTLYVASNLEGVGSPSPSYGKVENAATDGTLVCSPGEAYYLNGVRYECTGYTYEWRDSSGTWSTPESRSATSFTLDATHATVRVTWQWQPVAYRIAISTLGTGSEKFTFDPAAAYPLLEGEGTAGGYFTSGTSVTITAQGATGDTPSTFAAWSGDVGTADASAATIVVAADGVKALTAKFATSWVYQAADSVITDGNWVLPVSVRSTDIGDDAAPLVITGCNEGSGILDLRNVNADIAGAGVGVVRAIGESAFNAQTGIIELQLPAEVVRVERYAFCNCSAIANLPDFSHLVYVGASAFQGCANLSGNPVFSALEEIGNNAFSDCAKFTGDLRLPKLANAVYQGFSRCGFDGVLDAPAMTASGYQTFLFLKITAANCPRLAAVGSSSFWGCDQMQSITLADNWTSVGTASFIACSALVDISPAPFPASFTGAIARQAFQSASLAGLEATLPAGFAGFTTDGKDESLAFEGTKLVALDLSATQIAELPQGLFRNCTELERVALPATITTIGPMVFGTSGSVEKLLEVDFAGQLPATVDDGWTDFPNNGVSRLNREYKIVLRIPWSKRESWLGDDDFVALADVEDVESKPFYATVSGADYKHLVGTWRNAWVSLWNDEPGTLVIIR